MCRPSTQQVVSTPNTRIITVIPLPAHVRPVSLEHAYRLINHGPTILVSASDADNTDVMAASWACALDFAPPKLTVVLDKSAYTRQLVERSGHFVIQVPTLRQAVLTHAVGSTSLQDTPDKLARCQVELFHIADHPAPLVAGCSAWLACQLINEPHNQATYDLFIGEVVGAWADERIFRDGHWQYEHADAEWKSLHYIAGGHFYAIGDAVDVDSKS